MNKSITLQLLRNIAQVEARILSAKYYEDQTEDNDKLSLDACNVLEQAEINLSLFLNKN
jgi:cell division FtsZ-interacting protein ZapD